MNFSTYRPDVRLKAFKDAPLRSKDNYQIGFYDIGVLRQLMNSSDANEFRVAALPIPQNVFDRAELEKIVRHPSVQYALVDKTKIVLCSIKGCNGWLGAINEAGFKVKGGGKTAKRLKSFHRASLINAHYDHLRIQWVEPTAYTRYDFENGDWSPWVKEATSRLLDGGFVISSRLIHKALADQPLYYTNNETLDPNDVYYDPEIRRKRGAFLVASKVFNGRIFTPEGVIKGNFIVSDNLPEYVDVITSRENLKKEIEYHNGYRLIAEPQGPKTSVITDDQTVINLPKLFRKSDLEFWLKEQYEIMFEDAKNDRLLQDWKFVFVRQFSKADNYGSKKKEQTPADLEAQTRVNYVGYRWKSMGLSITDSPWLFKTLAISHARPLENRIPIPCSVYEQIIPESLARMAGFDIIVEEGTIRRINSVGIHVVNDFDWLEMYESHGGHDQDDFFKLFYRTMKSGSKDGKKVVIVARSPNGYGEYSIFDYVEGEWYPKWKKSDGEVVTFPEVNGRNWPVRLSDAIRARKVRYVGLPSDNNPSPKPSEGEQYSVKDFMSDVDTAMNGGNVGRFVNSSMLHSNSLAKHRPVQVCSLESAIDGCTQTSNPLDRTAIDAEAEIILQEVIDSGAKVDHDLWYGRFANFAKKHPEVETYEGTLTHMNNLCKTYFNKYVDRVTKYSQTEIAIADPINKLANRLRFHALPTFRRFNMSIYNTNSGEFAQSSGTISREEWDYIYGNVVKDIESFVRIEDRHDFVIALYAVCMTEKNGSGRVSDQIMMNPVIYPYLERALIHYGIASRVLMTFNNGKYAAEQTKYDKWTHIDPDGSQHSFTDVFEYQDHHAQFSPIVFTNVDSAVKRERRTESQF